MNIEEFSKIFYKTAQEADIKIDESQVEKFYKYMNLLIEWNEKINLTAITNPKEIIVKHFIDSILIGKCIKNGSTIIDVGTGAVFKETALVHHPLFFKLLHGLVCLHGKLVEHDILIHQLKHTLFKCLHQLRRNIAIVGKLAKIAVGQGVHDSHILAGGHIKKSSFHQKNQAPPVCTPAIYIICVDKLYLPVTAGSFK